MQTTEAFVGLDCVDCDARVDAAEATGRCPDCGGILDPAYDYDRVDPGAIRSGGSIGSMWRFEDLLAFPQAVATSLDEGGTPLVDCDATGEEIGVGRVAIKDEGRSTTGSIADRGIATATTAASQEGAATVALPSTGGAGQSAAAYAARAGLDVQVFLPSRSGFSDKAMVNVHGGDMSVVEGRIGDAIKVFEDAGADEKWHSLRAFETPYRHDGEKTALYEIVADLDWEAPDAIVCPTGTGTTLYGLYKGVLDLVELGLLDEIPALYAAQASGCAPIVEAVENGLKQPDPWESPDTICGGLEIPDPEGGALAIEAIEASGGGAVATDDEAILESACTVAAIDGVEIDVSGGAGVSGTAKLVEEGRLGADDSVVVLNPGAANKVADVLRSHLMRKGI